MKAKGYDGDIPGNYDRDLGPVLFQPYAEETARRVSSWGPPDVLEVAAGSGVVTRALRDRLPADAKLTATDISEDMLAVARAKFVREEQASFEIVDACDLPYPAICSSPTDQRRYARPSGRCVRVDAIFLAYGTRKRTIHSQMCASRC
jgi:SAM-dependent methyltransferase